MNAPARRFMCIGCTIYANNQSQFLGITISTENIVTYLILFEVMVTAPFPLREVVTSTRWIMR